VDILRKKIGMVSIFSSQNMLVATMMLMIIHVIFHFISVQILRLRLALIELDPMDTHMSVSKMEMSVMQVIAMVNTEE